MARSQRRRRATNKLDASNAGDLIKVDPPPIPDSPAHVYRTQTLRVARPTIFTAEFEALIELIAIDRVYRAMMERRGNRLQAWE
jgi:hypothetical protein